MILLSDGLRVSSMDSLRLRADAKFVSAKGKTALLQLATLALYLRELLEHYRRDRFMLRHFACAPDVHRSP